MTDIKDDIANRFEYHPPPNDNIVKAHEAVRTTCRMSADILLKATPPGREQSLAITKLEEAMFWANAAIARSHA
jgi:hypothetical protein